VEYATKILLILTLLPSLAFADCAQNVQVIKQGQTANCDGFVFSDAGEKQAEQDRSDALFYKSYSDSLTQKTTLQANENDKLQKRLNLYVQESSTLSTQVAKQNSNEGLYRFGYFLLGIVVTGLAVRNVRQ
jgi:hypothetical protein